MEHRTFHIHNMFLPLPQSVCDQNWRAWEAKRMQHDDFDAALVLSRTVDTSCSMSDSEMSCVSEADSSTSRSIFVQSNARHRGGCIMCNAGTKGGNELHLQGLVNDISAVLSRHTGQPRGLDGKFGPTTKRRSEPLPQACE